MAGDGADPCRPRSARPGPAPRRWPWPPPWPAAAPPRPRSTRRCRASYRVTLPSWSLTCRPSGSTWVTIEPMCSSTPSLPRSRAARADSFGPNIASGALAAVEQQHPGVLRLDVPVLAAQRLGGDLADLPGQFHAGRPGADQGEGEPAGPFGRVAGGLGHLERAEYPPPDLQGVLDGLHPGRDRGVLVVPEVGLPDAGGQDEVVVAELDLAAQRPPGQHLPPVRIDTGHLGDDEFGVAVFAEQLAQRGGDLALGQDAGRALVQHRLEQVMLGPVDEGDLDRRARQHPDGEQAREAAPHDHYPAGT